MVFRTIQIGTVAFTVYKNSARDIVQSDYEIVVGLAQFLVNGLPKFEREKVSSCLWLSSGILIMTFGQVKYFETAHGVAYYKKWCHIWHHSSKAVKIISTEPPVTVEYPPCI